MRPPGLWAVVPRPAVPPPYTIGAHMTTWIEAQVGTCPLLGCCVPKRCFLIFLFGSGSESVGSSEERVGTDCMAWVAGDTLDTFYMVGAVSAVRLGDQLTLQCCGVFLKQTMFN